MKMKTTTAEQGGMLSDLLKFEIDHTYCRDKGLGANSIKFGQIVVFAGILNSVSLWERAEETVAAGAVLGVALNDAEDDDLLVILRRGATVARAALDLLGTEEQQAAVIEKLRASGIAVAESA